MNYKKKKLNWHKVLIVCFCGIFLVSGTVFGYSVLQRVRAQQDFEKLAEATQIETSSNVLMPEHKRDIEGLQGQNPDCIGWIYIEGTNVNYPVMHTPYQPQKYLYKGFDGKYSELGTPFLDYECTLESGNIIIYGHNMNNGKMFSDICNYLDEEYMAAHQLIEFETSDGCEYYEVIDIRHIHQTDDWYANLEPEDGKEYLTLSTCYGANDERLIVIAEKSE